MGSRFPSSSWGFSDNTWRCLSFHFEIRVQEAIAEVAGELNPDGSAQQQSKAVNKVKKKARKILQEMVATVSPAMIRY